MSNDNNRFLVIEAGFTGDEDTARPFLTDNDPSLRVSAIRALHRMRKISDVDLQQALTDSDAHVRRTAVECAVHHIDVAVHHLVDDEDVFVAEAAAWCVGERPVTDAALETLISAAMHHNEAVVREAAAAALGSLGDTRGLDAILHACTDKPAVRRRAILALAPFEGSDVDAALEKALHDRDWQVRQNAEILISPRERIVE